MFERLSRPQLGRTIFALCVGALLGVQPWSAHAQSAGGSAALVPGLSVRYYPSTDLSGGAVATANAGPVSFSAANGWVVAAVGAQNWSARYQGYIEAPITGTLTLWTLSDDGVRVSVNGARVIDNWTPHPRVWNSGNVSVVRGQRVPIQIDYFQGRGAANLELHWQWSGRARALVPRKYLWSDSSAAPSNSTAPAPAQTPVPPSATPPDPAPQGLAGGLAARYYRGMTASGTVRMSRIEGPVSFNFPNGQLTSALGRQNWSAHYQGYIEAPLTGALTLMTRSDDGVRLSLNGARARSTIGPTTRRPGTVPPSMSCAANACRFRSTISSERAAPCCNSTGSGTAKRALWCPEAPYGTTAPR